MYKNDKTGKLHFSPEDGILRDQFKEAIQCARGAHQLVRMVLHELGSTDAARGEMWSAVIARAVEQGLVPKGTELGYDWSDGGFRIHLPGSLHPKEQKAPEC